MKGPEQAIMYRPDFTDCLCEQHALTEIADLRAQIAALEDRCERGAQVILAEGREIAALESREASLCDFLNSWAREARVDEAERPEANKALVDRLWGKFAALYDSLGTLLRIKSACLESAEKEVGELKESIAPFVALAKAAHNKIMCRHGTGMLPCAHCSDALYTALAYAAEQVAQARAEEREACANIVERWSEMGLEEIDLEEIPWPSAEQLAAAIRARRDDG